MTSLTVTLFKQFTQKIFKIRQFFLIFFDSLLNTCTLYALNFFTIHNFLQNKILNNFDLVVYCKHSRGGVLICCVSPLLFRSIYSFFLCQVFSSTVYLLHLHNYCLHVFCFVILVPLFCNFLLFFLCSLFNSLLCLLAASYLASSQTQRMYPFALRWTLWSGKLMQQHPRPCARTRSEPARRKLADRLTAHSGRPLSTAQPTTRAARRASCACVALPPKRRAKK